MFEQQVDRYYHMTCDICGKKETIKEENNYMFPGFWTRHWHTVIMQRFGDYSRYGEQKSFDLCPTCARKFKKLVKMTEVEDGEENNV